MEVHFILGLWGLALCRPWSHWPCDIPHHKGYQTPAAVVARLTCLVPSLRNEKNSPNRYKFYSKAWTEKRLTKLPMNSRPVLGTHNQPKQKPRQNQHITYHRQTESYHRQQGSATSNSCQPQKRLPPATHCLLEDSNGAVNHLGYNLLHRWVKYLSGIRHQSVATASALRHQTIKSMTINTNCPEWLWTFINPLHSPKI